MIFGGAAGGGKTFALLLEPLRHRHVPGFGAVLFRRTFPEISNEGGVWDMSCGLYPHAGGIPRYQREWRFPSGASVQFAHLQYEADITNWDGAQVALIEFDQLESFAERQFWYLFSRNRSTCGVRPYLRASCNPVPADDRVGGWLHTLLAWWLDPVTGLPIPERAGVLRYLARVEEDVHWADTPEALQTRLGLTEAPKSFTFIPAALSDNPILIEKDPGYRANLMLLQRADRERLLDGNWNARPTAGQFFNRAWFPLVEALPAVGIRWVRYWDKAGTQDGGKRTAGVKLGRDARGVYYVGDVVLGQWSCLDREAMMRQTAQRDGPCVEIWMEQEPGSSGKDVAALSIRNLAGFVVHAEPASGDKFTRASPFAAQAEAGNIRVLRASWTEAYLQELQAAAPGARYLDQMDASAGAFNKLASSVQSAGLPSGVPHDAGEGGWYAHPW